MFESQHTETEAGMHDSELISEFATWIERVTQPPSAADYRPRHRAEGDAR